MTERQNVAVLVRLSLEADDEDLSATAPGRKQDRPASSSEKWRPVIGRGIKSRDEQEKDACGFVESREGRYVYTYEEPDTSAWKRKRVRQPDATVAYRVILPVFDGALADLQHRMAPEVVKRGPPGWEGSTQDSEEPRPCGRSGQTPTVDRIAVHSRSRGSRTGRRPGVGQAEFSAHRRSRSRRHHTVFPALIPGDHHTASASR